MELAGLEPATSWVRSSDWGISLASMGQGSRVITGDLASPWTMVGRSCEFACTRLVPARPLQRVRRFLLSCDPSPPGEHPLPIW
jgi:hypothetical protein